MILVDTSISSIRDPAEQDQRAGIRGCLPLPEHSLDGRINVSPQRFRIHFREREAPTHEFRNRDRRRTHRPQLSNWLSASGHDHAFSPCDAVHNVVPMVAKVPHRHVRHDTNVLRVRQPMTTGTRKSDPARSQQWKQCFGHLGWAFFVGEKTCVWNHFQASIRK